MRPDRLGCLAVVVLLGCGGVYSDPLDVRGRGWLEVDSPTSNNLLAISGTSPVDVWAVGEKGTILHWNGDRWQQVQSPTSYDLHDVWAWAADLAWAVGDQGTVVSWNGVTWSLHSVVVFDVLGDPTDMQSVTGTGADDIWVLPEGLVRLPNDDLDHGAVHWDGSSWRVVWRPDGGSDDRFHAIQSNDVWIAADPPQHWNGSGWYEVELGYSGYFDFYGLWGDRSDNVWMVGTQSLEAVVFTFNGGSWLDQAEGLGQLEPRAVWGAGNQVWVVGLLGAIAHWDSKNWTVQRSEDYGQKTLLAVWGSSASDVWAVGWEGTILRHVD